MDFFGKVGKTMAGVGENIGINSDITRMNNEIEKEEVKINQLFYFIGKSYYEAHKNDINAEEHDRILQVNNSLSRIDKLKEEINSLRNVTVCDNCGSEIPINSTYCIKCGAKVREVQKQEFLCPSCNKAVGKDEIFCRNCGTKLKDNE
ncbi:MULTISPECIES: zinc ribbon domain-containing protein [Anaerococcus]|jgi:conserved domain protein|uniref:Zinc ribbon domain-containing protein n=1 Tax=Anaerococcus nagyae TaxID=1755241 RepID=A0A3E2TFK6_9FIRM|nr:MULTISPECIES: zinc ribbon domain-containing protein [Anaerococcus]MBP2070196.1 ribosomal protein L40E [Anaerococcus nagyae]MDU2354415.1 zinc ribbon domain-containing protein [Anaerococcus sp.]MDU2566523.1 zinc ribbon domain-containing protein [Anaerococcus sp.]RGB74582.1 zinc ribbon domain-containing protein [Anaerococcus nagyae]